MSDFDDDAVGYKSPPKGTRYQKGQSGNPQGRPRGSGLKNSAKQVAHRRVTLTIDGQHRTMPAIEAVQLMLLRSTLGGNVGAARELLKVWKPCPDTGPSVEAWDSRVTVVKVYTAADGQMPR